MSTIVILQKLWLDDVGADISHPGVGQKDQPSIAAVCAFVEPVSRHITVWF
jgi:hypothetical protein